MKIFRRLVNIITFLILATFEVLALIVQAIDSLVGYDVKWKKRMLKYRLEEFKETAKNFIKSGFLEL